MQVPDIGNLPATVLTTAIPDFKAFKDGGEFAAYLDLVLIPQTTSGKPQLGTITKMDNRDARWLMAVGAIAYQSRFKRNAKGGALGDWADKLLEAQPCRIVAVALANMFARIAWALMSKNARYDANHDLRTA